MTELELDNWMDSELNNIHILDIDEIIDLDFIGE